MTTAPSFELPDQDGQMHALEDYRGRWLVLYFYPKDDTPGCTTEACQFRDMKTEIEKVASLVGISTDSVQSHKEFSTKYHLNFPILSDPSHEVLEQYHSWGLKKYKDKEYVGTSRNTFLISPTGEIIKEYLGVDPQTHAEEILKDLQSLQRAA